MTEKKQPLTAEKRREWANLTHLAFLDALALESGFEAREIAFQGGTSLHLGWHSPRFSEDLNFLVAHRDPHAHLTTRMGRLQHRMGRFVLAHDPGLRIELTDQTKAPDRMIVFEARVSHPNWMGKARVKMEFWRVPTDYLAAYENVLRVPGWRSGDLMARIEASSAIPMATPESVLADKIVALAYRERLKWRDLFDVWWLDQQAGLSDSELAARAVRHATAYNGPSLREALRGVLAQESALRAGEGCDLDRWLPESLVAALIPDRVSEIVDVTLRHVRGVLAELETCDSSPLGEDATAQNRPEPGGGRP